ncbi:hypothetical protein TIFTF001_010410 [Ficus carica]|uniref:Uncharacterized protein n=1 Tax=Ficus carica TaxID=3494 RepID=A0AA88AC70_FICCA|nr:hypothetical protein TIFTF001_010410 [Ficus carica]
MTAESNLVDIARAKWSKTKREKRDTAPEAEDDLGGREGVEETAGGRTEAGWAEEASFFRAPVLADLWSRSERSLAKAEERMGFRGLRRRKEEDDDD